MKVVEFNTGFIHYCGYCSAEINRDIYDKVFLAQIWNNKIQGYFGSSELPLPKGRSFFLH